MSTRIARIACTPVVGMVSQQLWSFHSDSQGYLQSASGLEVSFLIMVASWGDQDYRVSCLGKK